MSKDNVKKDLEQFWEFPIPTYEEWRKVTEKSLKGASFEKKLITKTYEGIDLQPMYRDEDLPDQENLSQLPGHRPYTRGTQVTEKAWEVAQEIAVSTPIAFNEVSRHDLSKGQTVLNIRLDKVTRAGKNANEDQENVGVDGLSVSTLADVKQALSNIDLGSVPVHIDSGEVSVPILTLVAAYLQEQKVKEVKGCIGMDPIAELVSTGSLSYDLDTAYDLMADVTAWAKQQAPELQTILVKGHPYHDGGGSAVEEVAYALATATEYVAALQERGMDVNDIAPRIRFSFSIGSDYFIEVAKLRAARTLWSTIVKAFVGNKEAQKMIIHGRTSAWTKTVYDPYVNMLRGTSEAFAAAVGGVDSLHVSPFDEPIQKSTAFSRRIARNTQIILQQEAHITKTADPAGGSWYVEVLTDELANKIWSVFQDIEATGGIIQALQSGQPQAKVAEVREKRAKNIEHRKDKFVGTNMYANMTEKPVNIKPEDDQSAIANHIAAVEQAGRVYNLVEVKQATGTDRIEQAIRAAKEGATIADLAEALGKTTNSIEVTAIPQGRGAEKFEQLRKKTEEMYEKTGKRPQVFLANLGPIPSHKARADFITGFFEVGGFEVIKNDGFDQANEAAEAALEANAEIVVICGKDESYQEMVAPITKQVKESKSETSVFLAGKPSEEDRALFEAAGLDGFIHIGSNCYEVLAKLQQEKGVTLS
ncbi:acyl-CoA mutase large subunit family protein [Desertibacillus haloalkaliphilus]|nr:acyl-CoA mutase large subunit family protein [Desertibacillus haloalkaliphilus]